VGEVGEVGSGWMREERREQIATVGLA